MYQILFCRVMNHYKGPFEIVSESRETGPAETIISDSPVNQPSRNASLVFDLYFSNMKTSYASGSSIETPSVSIVSYGSILSVWLVDMTPL